MHPPLTVILLAAGKSQRMLGPDKRLLTLNGEPLLRRSAQLYLKLGLNLTVVTGPNDAAVQAVLTGLPLKFAVNPDPESDHIATLRAGLNDTEIVTRGVMIALADQPLLTTADIAALIACFDMSNAIKITIPTWQGHRGNPVIFPSYIIKQLSNNQALNPRKYIDSHPQEIAWYKAANNHFTRDVDTPQDAVDLLDHH